LSNELRDAVSRRPGRDEANLETVLLAAAGELGFALEVLEAAENFEPSRRADPDAEEQHATRGFAGFRAFVGRPDGTPVWRADPAFISGAGGVAVALIAATSDSEPIWDRALCLS
jgi:hypothetical protein